MNSPKFINVSKLDAARRQLEHGIKLFFKNGDVVVTHSITASAYQILLDLRKTHGIKSVLYDEAIELIKVDKRDEYRNILRDSGNFFKHANSDTDRLLKFYFQTTEYQIFDSCMVYQRLTNEIVPLFHLYICWFYTQHSEFLNEGALKSGFLEISKGFDSENRVKFFQELLPTFEAQSIS